MISRPYHSGSDDPQQWKTNLQEMNQYACQVFDKGHIPIIGVNAALPIIEAAGQHRYDEMMMPISIAMAERCDAVLRIGGPSKGADDEVDVFKQKGLPVYLNLEDIPAAPNL